MKHERKYWLFVTNDLNWKTIKNDEIYGFTGSNQKDLDKLSIGDLVILYIKGMKLGGAFAIKSTKSDTTVKFNSGDYPNQIQLEKIVIPEEIIDFTPRIISRISIFRGAKKWGIILMGRAIKEITKEDYGVMKKELNQNWNKEDSRKIKSKSKARK